MMAKLSLPALQALLADGGYGGRAYLEGPTSALGLSAALLLSNLNLWQGDGYYLTVDEIDEIQEMVAQLESDLMNTGSMFVVDKVRATNSIDLDIIKNSLVLLTFDAEDYDPEGMHSIVANTERINIINDGLHIITVNVYWSPSPVGGREVLVYKYDSDLDSTYQVADDFVYPTVGAGWATNNIMLQDDCKVGDYFKLYAYQTSAITLQIKAATYSPFFAVVRL